MAPLSDWSSSPAISSGAVKISGSISNGSSADFTSVRSLSESGVDAALDWLAGQDLSRAPLIYATADPAQVRAAMAEGAAGVISGSAIVAAAATAGDPAAAVRTNVATLRAGVSRSPLDADLR